MGVSIEEAQKVANENTASQMTVTTNNYYIYAEALDSNGNKVTATKQISNIDKIAPTKPVITNSSEGNLTNKNVEVTITSQDTLSGIDHYEWFENNAWTTRALTTTNGVGKITFSADRKDLTIRFRAIDKVGNISEESTTIINLDKTAPVLSPITNSSNGNWTNQKIDLSWTITENGSGIQKVQFSYDGKQWTGELSKNEWYGLSRNNEGNDVLYIRAIDNAGNVSNVSSTNMKIDKTPPTVELDKNGGTYTVAQNSNFVPITTKITAQDANGGTGAPNSQIKEPNKDITLSTTKPSKTGYTFIGWSTNKNSSTAEYQPGAIYSNNESVTLYAVWKINSYSLTVNPNGGTWNNTTSSSSIKQNYGSTKAIANPTPPSIIMLV